MSPECTDGSRSWRVYRAAGRPARFGVCDDARTSAASLVKSGLGRTRIMAKAKHPPAPCEMGEETARLRALPWQEKEKGRDERPTDQSADDDGDEDGGDHQQEIVRSETQDLNRPWQKLGTAFGPTPLPSRHRPPP